MMRMKTVRALVSLVALGAGTVQAVSHGTGAPPASVGPSGTGTAPGFAPAASTLRQLRGVDELKSWFNGYRGRPRLIFLVSPT